VPPRHPRYTGHPAPRHHPRQVSESTDAGGGTGEPQQEKAANSSAQPSQKSSLAQVLQPLGEKADGHKENMTADHRDWRPYILVTAILALLAIIVVSKIFGMW
jgi:hypothetical protein